MLESKMKSLLSYFYKSSIDFMMRQIVSLHVPSFANFLNPNKRVFNQGLRGGATLFMLLLNMLSRAA